MANVVTQPRPATYQDLLAIPANLKAEIIDGELHTQPRPRKRHQEVIATVSEETRRAYHRKSGSNRGTWIILPEPGIELPDAPEIAPDVAGWRAERLDWSDDGEAITVVPDWVCEVLSPSNRKYDKKIKFPFYARIGVEWLWVVDLSAHAVDIKRNINGAWTDVATFLDDDAMRADPFPDAEIALASLWPR